MRGGAAIWRGIAALLLVARIVSAQDLRLQVEPDQPVVIDADELEYLQEDTQIGARGNVVVTHGSSRLWADHLHYSHERRTARVRGGVRVESDAGRLTANEADFNLEDETGELINVELHAKDERYSLWGDRAEKRVGQSYHIENGRFTTCRCADGAPSWSISGDQFDLSVGGYADVRGGRFNILDYPVLYVPRALFPVEIERQSGFLMPRFGASSRRGFQTLLPFYLAIDKSQDATVALDVETSARAGLLGEYRYALSRRSSGSLGGAYFNESFRGTTQAITPGSRIPENRWNVQADQHHSLLGGINAYSNLFLVSDDLFLREINTYSLEHPRVVATRTLPYTDSRIGLMRSWDRFAVRGEAIYYQNLAQPSDVTESQTLQRLPEARIWGQQTLFDSVIATMDISAASFQRGRGTDGFRADLQPGLRVPLPLGRYAFGFVQVRGRETAYRLFDNELADGTRLPSLRSRETFRVDAVAESSLGRIFATPWDDGGKLKHVVEPLLAYTFVPNVAQDDLPFFDGVDRVNARNQVTYGFTTRLLEKKRADEVNRPAVREIARFSVAQSVDINRQIEPISCEIISGEPCGSDHFSDLDLAGRLNPSHFLSLRFRSNYDTNNTNLSAAQVGIFIQDPRVPPKSEDDRRVSTTTSAGISYRFLAPNRLQQVDANLVVELTRWAGFLYSSRYDVVQQRFLDNFYGFRFLSQCDCWSLDLTVTDRTNPRELEVRAQVSLVGLGSSTSQRRAAFVP